MGVRGGEPGGVPAAGEPRGETRQSVFGSSLHFVGEIHSTGSVRVEGHIEGPLTARVVFVGTGGRVEGPITAEIAQIEGAVAGDLDCDTVSLGRTARFSGAIAYRSLSVETGALLTGQVRRKAAKPEKPAATKAGAEKPEARSPDSAQSAIG